MDLHLTPEDAALQRRARAFTEEWLFPYENECEEHDGMQRPQATKAPDRERAQAFQGSEPTGVAMGNDETAQHEKEIHEQICVADEIQRIDRAIDVEMKHRDQQCGDAAPAIQHTKVHPGHFDRR